MGWLRRRLFPPGVLGTELAEQEEQEEHPAPVTDLARAAEPPKPPEPGAQWDELHRRWERWDDDAQAWVVVGQDRGDDVDPAEENLLPPLLARELRHAEDLEATEEHVPDVDRQAEPPAHLPGAQWNEVAGRWERWDEVAGEWVATEA